MRENYPHVYSRFLNVLLIILRETKKERRKRKT
jgi:hypothetical protein